MFSDPNDPYQPTHCSSLLQQTLFPFRNVEHLEVETGVSSDEMSRWAKNGWISFEPINTERFDEQHRVEIEFVKGIVRSGLSDEWIDKLLSRLEIPYCYNPKKTFYSFVDHSWKTVPTIPEPEDAVGEYLHALADDEHWDVLLGLADRINDLLGHHAEDNE